MSATLFVENRYSVRQFPTAVVTADEEPAGFEAFRVADGRRSIRDYATATTANDPWWVKTAHPQVFASNMVALDRGHNLAGKEILLQASNDDFATIQIVLDITLPTGSAPGQVDDTLGVVTEEGAWLKRFPTVAAAAWRLYVPALGTGLKPQIVGLQLGMCLQVDLSLPLSPGRRTFQAESRNSPLLWVGRNRGATRAEDTLHLSLPTVFDYQLARYHLEGLFARGRPMWVIHDDTQAERAIQVIPPEGAFGFARAQEWFYPKADIPYQEHAPLEAA